MKRAPRPLKRVMAEDATLAAWQARHAREQALLKAVRARLPRQIGERVRVADPGNGEIELTVGAGAVATALRQRSPDVLAGLQRDGWPVRSIRVRVSVNAAAPEPLSKAPPLPERGAMRPLAQLARDLPPGALRDALTRLTRKVGT